MAIARERLFIAAQQASESSWLPTASLALRHQKSTKDWYPPHHSHDPSRSSHYVDRDDPRHGRADSNRTEDHYKPRRRSRSPDFRTSQTSGPAPEQGRVVRWKDLRLPTNDQPNAGSVATSAASNKVFTSKVAATAATKRMATDISKWNRKQAEMHASGPLNSVSSGNRSEPPSAHPNASARSSAIVTQSSNKVDLPDTSEGGNPPSLDSTKMSESELASYNYKDHALIACLLCQRKFRSLDTLHRHEAESQLHKDNLSNSETCRQGVARKLEALSGSLSKPNGTADKPATASVSSESTNRQILAPQSAPAYRDRASERRAVFGADTPSKSNTSSNASKVFEGPRTMASASTAVAEVSQSAPEKPIDSDNIGSKLLAMMGWSQGQGLGLKGEGRTDIVETKIYKPGAGLGSSTPADAALQQASRRPESNIAFTGYLDRAKDREYLL
ncbi:related to RNA binding motif protein [Ustilago trichophora]|uniref:Related to RNA binding motif protein n=1 Tax=Ustilago trichophora TaxID=86804 RepID=A0A5C3E6T0_9BASI|nr:related to RNA binding motif protein [Ustilago trichophora]